MEYDTEKVDEAVLALLHLSRFENQGVSRAWKGHDWDALNRLFDKGMIHDPVGKAKSVVFSDEGKEKAAELFRQLFGK